MWGRSVVSDGGASTGLFRLPMHVSFRSALRSVHSTTSTLADASAGSLLCTTLYGEVVGREAVVLGRPVLLVDLPESQCVVAALTPHQQLGFDPRGHIGPAARVGVVGRREEAGLVVLAQAED